ncbi:hypothetical protein ACHAQJ_010284 [Trichoderma viride]
MSGIPFDEMPSAFQDAVMLTQALGLRIIRQDVKDWEEQRRRTRLTEQAASQVAIMQARLSATTRVCELQDGQICTGPPGFDLFRVVLLQRTDAVWKHLRGRITVVRAVRAIAVQSRQRTTTMHQHGWARSST